MFGDYMMFLSDQPYVKAQDTTEIKNLLKKIGQKSIELQRAIQKVRQARLGDDEKKEIDAAYEEEAIDYERKQLVDKVVKLREKPLVAFKPAPAKKVVAKKVMKPAMKKPMKKPIAFGNVETALTGKRPRKAPAKPTQVARFYVGGSVLPKGTKVPMPKKTTTTTMKARKPMSAETKQKIKNGVKAYHKNCKKAMAMYSTMKK